MFLYANVVKLYNLTVSQVLTWTLNILIWKYLLVHYLIYYQFVLFK